MRLSQIRDFVAVADAGSISAAARLLGVSQPGLTKSIRSLESDLHASLFKRTPRGIQLTQVGRTFYGRARAAHSELNKARQEVAELSGERTGRVAIGFGPLAASLVVPTAVARFHDHFPKVEVRLLEGFAHTIIPLVRDETLDAAVVARLPGYASGAALKFRPVFNNEQIIVARRGHPMSGARAIAELSEAEWLSFEPRPVVDRTLAALGLPGARRLMQCESLNVLVALLASSDFLAITSRRVLTLPQAAKAVHEIAITERMAPMATGIYTRTEAPLTRPAAAMVKMLVDVGRELPAM